MDVFAELTTSKDHPVSPSRLDFTISGSRFVIFPLQRSRVSRPSIAHFPGLALARRRRDGKGEANGCLGIERRTRFAAIFGSSRSRTMRPKRPTHILMDHVRIAREGNDAIIDHADANLSARASRASPR